MGGLIGSLLTAGTTKQKGALKSIGGHKAGRDNWSASSRGARSELRFDARRTAVSDNESFKASLAAYMQLNPSSDPSVLMQGFSAGWVTGTARIREGAVERVELVLRGIRVKEFDYETDRMRYAARIVDAVLGVKP